MEEVTLVSWMDGAEAQSTVPQSVDGEKVR